MFADEENRCIKLLLEYGLADKDKCNWLIQEQGPDKLIPNQQQTMQYQLRWAINNHHHDRAILLYVIMHDRTAL